MQSLVVLLIHLCPFLVEVSSSGHHQHRCQVVALLILAVLVHYIPHHSACCIHGNFCVVPVPLQYWHCHREYKVEKGHDVFVSVKGKVVPVLN
jgi:hypothetical protein